MENGVTDTTQVDTTSRYIVNPEWDSHESKKFVRYKIKNPNYIPPKKEKKPRVIKPKKVKPKKVKQHKHYARYKYCQASDTDYRERYYEHLLYMRDFEAMPHIIYLKWQDEPKKATANSTYFRAEMDLSCQYFVLTRMDRRRTKNPMKSWKLVLTPEELIDMLTQRLFRMVSGKQAILAFGRLYDDYD